MQKATQLDFQLTSQPLNLYGSVASPPNAMAIFWLVADELNKRIQSILIYIHAYQHDYQHVILILNVEGKTWVSENTFPQPLQLLGSRSILLTWRIINCHEPSPCTTAPIGIPSAPRRNLAMGRRVSARLQVCLDPGGRVQGRRIQIN